MHSWYAIDIEPSMWEADHSIASLLLRVACLDLDYAGLARLINRTTALVALTIPVALFDSDRLRLCPGTWRQLASIFSYLQVISKQDISVSCYTAKQRGLIMTINDYAWVLRYWLREFQRDQRSR